jgi:GntR family transcriptional regulator / MocR family aminotransferase
VIAQPSDFLSFNISLDPTSAIPIYQQLYQELRLKILEGGIASGVRLPPTRVLGDALGISRNTVMVAYDQLRAEGYLEGHTGSGTFVSEELPDEILNVSNKIGVISSVSKATHRLSRRGEILANTPVTAAIPSNRPIAFKTGRPDFEAFPFRIWSQLVSKYWRNPPRELLEYPDPAGYGPLRSIIADYLRAARGVRCGEDQVIIVSGSQQALHLASRLLLNEGDLAWIEDPGYLGARGVFLGAGVNLAPVPVDERGLDVAAGASSFPGAKLVYVTPSRQYPLGVTMTLARRLELLEWARQNDAMILEDDYDSEYRYSGMPLSSMQGLDAHGRVIYIGTFSKVLFPSIRLGYMVVPPDLVNAFASARALLDRGSPSVEQAVMAEFIAEGHFAQHIRRMRSLYAKRRTALVDAIRRDLGGMMEIGSIDAGMQLVLWLPAGLDDTQMSRLIAGEGVDAQPISAFSIKSPERGGLLLGYTGVNEQEISEGIGKIAKALRNMSPIVE